MTKLIKIISGICALLLIIIAWNWGKVQHLQATLTLFDEDKIVHNFSHLDEAFDSVPFKKSGTAFEFETAAAPLPKTFTYRGETKDVQEFMGRRTTTALLVIKDDQITFEDYYLGTTESDKRISWSMGKSFVSALFGIYVEQGLIDIEKSVSDYVPMLVGSAYEGVKAKHVLQMSSGATWNEDYHDFDSDINRMGRALSLGGSLDEVAASVKTGPNEPGTKFLYVSMDTHVLGMVLRSVTGKSLPYLLEKHIWSEVQPEADGYWLTDGQGTAFALGGLNIRTRDYARFGRLFLNNGKWNGKEIIPEAWVKASTTPNGAHVTPGPNILGYGYQWWLAPNARPGEFFANGVYGQFIYINQPENIVIVKNSADLGFMNKIGSMEETAEFFRAITASLSTTTSE